MERANALQMRQNMGSVLQKLKETGSPILIEKGRTPMAVLISLEDYRKRFVDVEADQARRKLIQEIKEAQLAPLSGTNSLALIQSLRSPENRP